MIPWSRSGPVPFVPEIGYLTPSLGILSEALEVLLKRITKGILHRRNAVA